VTLICFFFLPEIMTGTPPSTAAGAARVAVATASSPRPDTSTFPSCSTGVLPRRSPPSSKQ
jgi:hypothetical protein